MNTAWEIAIAALCAWRENRGGDKLGMQSVLNSLCNRAAFKKTSLATEALKKLQYSSMTAPGDPNLVLFPDKTDTRFQLALAMAEQAVAGTLPDITGGATHYYALSMSKPPYWVTSTAVQTAQIQNQVFFKGVAF